MLPCEPFVPAICRMSSPSIFVPEGRRPPRPGHERGRLPAIRCRARSNRRAEADMSRTATITCPACGRMVEERMPLDACLYFWPCPHCGVVARPKAGDCCVFCSYGTEACPSRASDG
ncbi:MAG: GDCCVxC domain-containing (seleno)protein [Gemmatimonadales bacterium]